MLHGLLGCFCSVALNLVCNIQIHMASACKCTSFLQFFSTLSHGEAVQSSRPVPHQRKYASNPNVAANVVAAGARQNYALSANRSTWRRNQAGGPLSRNSLEGALTSKRSVRRVARDSITYSSSHQSSSLLGVLPVFMVRPWHAVEVMTRPCDIGKPVRVTR